MPLGRRSAVPAIAATVAGLLLVSLVALASGASPWQAGGGQDVSVGLVHVLAAAAGALAVVSLLVVWARTPSRQGRRSRLGTDDLETLGGSMSSAAKVVAIVAGAIALFLFLAVPLLAPPMDPTPAGYMPPGGPEQRALPSSPPAPAGDPASAGSTMLLVGWAIVLLLLASAAVVVRRRRVQRRRQTVLPDAAARVGSGLRSSLADLESERDPRRAVQRAYARMEESLGSIELPRAPDETPAEFTARILRLLGASAAAASELTGLFEIARFSDHPMNEADRRRAIASVRRVEAEVALR